MVQQSDQTTGLWGDQIRTGFGNERQHLDTIANQRGIVTGDSTDDLIKQRSVSQTGCCNSVIARLSPIANLR